MKRERSVLSGRAGPGRAACACGVSLEWRALRRLRHFAPAPRQPCGVVSLALTELFGCCRRVVAVPGSSGKGFRRRRACVRTRSDTAAAAPVDRCPCAALLLLLGPFALSPSLSPASPPPPPPPPPYRAGLGRPRLLKLPPTSFTFRLGGGVCARHARAWASTSSAFTASARSV